MIDPILDQIEKVLPARYTPWLILLILCLPYIGRAYAALKNGHGIIGIIRAILYGDPKPLDVVKDADAKDMAAEKYQPPPGAGPVAPPRDFYVPPVAGPGPVTPPHDAILPK